jgi:hypothetical protein
MLKRLSQKWSTTYPTEGPSMVLAKVFLLAVLAIVIYLVAKSPNYGGDWPPY